ncbi:MAG: DUF1127 domain-containing protein [Reyranellaceae bacterium]
MSDLTLTHHKEFWAEKPLLAGLAVVGEWRRRARARNELAHLSERDARDIGLTAAQISFEASKPFWRA